jgi:(2Fe-2S) ferredoxin
MSSPQYRVFVCTKQRSSDNPEGCCCRAGALDIYQAFQAEIVDRQLEDRVKIQRSGCLDRCESGAVAMVYRTNWREFEWLTTKVRMKLRRILFPNRHLYGHLTIADIPAIVDSHFIDGKPLKRCQIDIAK